MHHSSIRYIRRLLVGIIILVFLLVLGNFLYTRYRRNPAESQELQILSSDTIQSVESFEYSDTRDGMLRFKIRANRLLEERPGKNFLEGIEAFDFNTDGSVRNEILSRYAEYDRENRTADFTGDVHLFLGQDTELRTETLHYDMNADVGTTEDPVRFYSENLEGKARGLQYRLNRKLLELEHDVDFLISLEKGPGPGVAAVEKMKAASDKALCYENGSRIAFQGNARLQTDSLLLTGDTIRAEVDRVLNEITSLSCLGDASYRSETADESRILKGNRMFFDIHPGSRNLNGIRVLGQAEYHSVSANEERGLKGAEIKLYFDPLKDALRRIESRTGVELRMKRDTEETFISGEQFNAGFYTESRGLKNIDVRQHSRILMKGTPGTADNEIRAQQIDIKFREQSGQVALDALRAQHSAQWIFLSGGPNATAGAFRSGKLNADLIDMFYAKEGRFLDRINSSGKVVMSEISAGSEKNPDVRRISADRARINFFKGNNKPKDMTAEGDVRIVYAGEPTTDPSGNPGKFQTASDSMRAVFAPDTDGIALASVSQSGNFRYEDETMSATSGKCDYDAQDKKMTLSDSTKIFFEAGYATGDAAVFDLHQRTIQVRHNVRSTLSAVNEPGLLGESSTGSRTVIVAESMHYRTEDSHIRYTGNVQLLSEEQQLQAENLEILNRGERVKASGKIRHRIYRGRAFMGEGGNAENSSVPITKDDENFSGMPIIIESSNFKYLKDNKTFTYSGNTSLVSSDLELKSGTLEAVLNDSGDEIEWAIARNEVVVFKGKWECRGDIAYYFRVPERIEIVGEPAECIDPEGVKPSAPRLTYYVADDRILLEEQED